MASYLHRESDPTDWSDRIMSVEDFAASPRLLDARSELVRGRVLTRPFATAGNSILLTRLVCAVASPAVWSRPRTAAGPTVLFGIGIILSRHPDTVRTADIAYWADTSGITDLDQWPSVVPELVVEVVSQLDVLEYLPEKLADWHRAGCANIWIVDRATRTLMWRRAAGDTVFAEGDILDAGALIEGLTLDVGSLFRM